MKTVYKVIDTPMYPARWKVETSNTPGHDNSAHNFFINKENAAKECKRRNKSAVEKDRQNMIKYLELNHEKIIKSTNILKEKE